MSNDLMLTTSYQPPVITANFDEMRVTLASWMEPYEGLDDHDLEKMERKELADLRSDVNKMIKSVEDGRKAIKAEYNKPLAEFEAQVKALLEPAKAASDQLKRHIDRKDEMKRQGYREALESYYREVAGSLVGTVPFERIFDPDWVKSDAKYKAAFEALLDKCRRLSDDWAALKNMRGNLFDFDEAERELFRTLDLRQAMSNDEMRREEAERIKNMKVELGQDYAQEQPDPNPVKVVYAGPDDYIEPEYSESDFVQFDVEILIPETRGVVTTCRAELDVFKEVMERFGIHGKVRVV